MASDGSVAPKERVNIVYKSAVGDAQEQVELPFRQLVLGDFTLREEPTPLDERVPINVDKDTFSDVLKAQNLHLQLNVPNRLADSDEDEVLAVDLRFESINDFQPDALVEKVPELKQLIELRNALKALTGPLGNVPDFRRRLEHLVRDAEARAQLLVELGLSSTKEAE
ncbi:type VI secretion system contractile sheath small subunit [Paenalcaligenes faecalis]|uniref:type VI secretion system contractile sheath small subunit n=1 Tax=Paenalcaligenes faecalis TaxID=2980099 RepID=UPI0022B9CCA7|nr:type VI secretion system contractile sheath small subunit [Paenalcaligenes faecalis]